MAMNALRRRGAIAGISAWSALEFDNPGAQPCRYLLVMSNE
ncbi:hypothetical protein [Acerihabitans arboris]|nr:hypothetical protein [Acerihabitans arboris]